jgi:hypothetical protein
MPSQIETETVSAHSCIEQSYSPITIQWVSPLLGFRIHHSEFNIQNSAWRSVSHLRTRGIGPFRDQFHPDEMIAVRASRTDRILIEKFELLLFEPHESETLRTASDLRSHTIPLTLLPMTHPDEGRLI